MTSHRKHRIFTLLAGIAVALILVFSQLFYFQAANFCHKKAETEQSKSTEKKSDTFISIPSNSIISSSTVEINQELLFIIEVLVTDESPKINFEEAPKTINKLFQALFRVIISPNAP